MSGIHVHIKGTFQVKFYLERQVLLEVAAQIVTIEVVQDLTGNIIMSGGRPLGWTQNVWCLLMFKKRPTSKASLRGRMLRDTFCEKSNNISSTFKTWITKFVIIACKNSKLMICVVHHEPPSTRVKCEIEESLMLELYSIQPEEQKRTLG